MCCGNFLPKLFLISVFTIIATSSLSEWAVDDSGCRTPDGGIGNCILTQKCQSMTDFLQKAPKPLPKNVREAVQTFICGVHESGRLKVCCPSKPIEISKLIRHRKNHGNKVNPKVDPPVVTDGPAPPANTLLPEDCGNVYIDNKILNGDVAQLFDFPWMALLWYRTGKNTKDYRCAGSVVNERYILTAAHCVMNTKLPLVAVRIGEFDISTTIDTRTEEDGIIIQADPVQDLAIEQVLTHPDYSTTELYKNDIALIRTAQPMKFSETGARPICLPLGKKFSSFDYTRRYATITGWGSTEKARNTKKLMKAQVPILPVADCKQTPAFVDQKIDIDDRQLCADSKLGIDSCKGDSGGPLQIVGSFNDEARYIQHGIVSFGTAICRNQSEIPGVYTRVAAYMDWILANIKA